MWAISKREKVPGKLETWETERKVRWLGRERHLGSLLYDINQKKFIQKREKEF